MAVPKCPLCLLPLFGALTILTPATLVWIKVALGAVSLALLVTMLWKRRVCADQCNPGGHR